jgi:hypothetical protein
MTGPCPHFETVIEVAPARDVCETCILTGDRWVHLRQCLVCGLTGCCDNSPNTHATKHAKATGHAIIRSAQPGEDWAWCYPDEAAFIPGPGGWELVEY